MAKKLILSQEQLDEIVGENISKSGVYGEEGVNDDSPNTESNPGFPGITIIPDDMKNSKDKDGESDIEYKPTTSDDITKFIAHPDPAAYLNQTRGSRYYPGAVVYEESYTKEEFEKMALNEEEKTLKNLPITIPTTNGGFTTNINYAKKYRRDCVKNGDIQNAKLANNAINAKRKVGETLRKAKQTAGIGRDRGVESGIFSTDN